MSIKKRFLSGISALALAISAFSGVLTSDMFSVSTKVEALGYVEGGSGSLPSGENGDFSYKTYQSSCGVRLYLVKKAMCSTKVNTDGLSQSTLHYLYDKNLSSGSDIAKDYALYDFSTNSSYCSAVLSGSSSAYAVLGDGTSTIMKIDKDQMMSSHDFGGANWGFNSTVKTFGDWYDGSSSNFDSLKNWCNANLGTVTSSGSAVDNFTASDLSDFLDGYRNKLTSSVYDKAGLPKSVSEYVQGQWTIIVEPVLVMKNTANSTFYVVGYQDFFGYGLTTSYKNYHHDYASNSFLGLQGTGSAIFYDLADTIGDTIYSCSKFYSKYEDSYIAFKAISSEGSKTAGFGVFGVNNSIYGGSVEAHVNKHYSIYADQLSGDYNLNWKGGSGCNKGVGQLAVAKKDTVGATDEYKWTGSLSDSTIKSNYWSTPLANLKFYSWGSSVDDISLKNSNGTFKKANTASTSSEALRRLVGASTDSWTNSPTLAKKNANDYILVETSSNVVEFVNSYNLSALLGKDSTITTDSKFNLKNLPNLDVTVGSTGLSLPSSTKVNPLYQNQTGFKYNARLDFSDDNDSAANTHLADVAQSLVTNTFLTCRGGVDITFAFNSHSTSRLSSSEVTNIWGNTNGYATAGFKTSDYDRTNRSTVDMINNKIGLANKYSYVGLTLDYFVQDVKVKSSKKSLTRGEDGAISKGSTINSTEYSIFSNGYHILNNAKLGASGVTYVVSFPNSKANSSYSLIDADGAQNFSNLIFTDDVSYNNVEGLSNLKAVINSKISKATVIPVGNEDTFDFYVGAFQDVGKSTSNSFVGYSVYLVEDNMVTPNQDTSMQLKAYEANFVYPTLLGDTEGHIIRTVGTDDLSEDSSFSGVWISKTQDYSGTAINRELVHTNMFDLLYSTAKIKVAEDTWLKQNFKAEATDPKKFTSVGTTGIWLNHQVNLSRGTFGENLVASSFSTKNRSTFSDDYITKTLGYSLGTKGAESPSGLAVGKTSLMSSGSDAFKWACNKAATITSNVFRDYGYTYTVSPFIGGENINDAGYDVSESSYRYITNSRNTGKGVSGQLDLQTSGNYSAMFSKTYDDVLNFYPEVDMIAYKYNAASAKLSATGADLAVTQERLAVLGEKQRSVNPTGVFSIRVVGDSHSLAGVTKSDTVATGSDAKKLSEKFGNLQVIYAGGNVNLSTESAYEINVSGFILDQIDINVDGKDENKIVSAMGADTAYNAIIADNSDLKNIWGNSSYNTADKYAAWIKSFKESLAVDVSLNTCKNADGSGVVKTYNGFKVSSSKATGGDIKAITSYALTYKGGTVVNDDAYKALIRAIATEYYGDASDSSISKAKTLFVNSGINKSILDSIESCKDSDNGSEVVEDIFGKNTKWYDEQVRTFVVRYYKCDPVKIGKVLVNDKIDINAGPSQDKKTQKLFQNGYVGQWNMTVYLSKAVTSLPDMVIYSPKNGNLDAAINSGSVLIAKQHVEGADFIISDATTSDARN